MLEKLKLNRAEANDSLEFRSAQIIPIIKGFSIRLHHKCTKESVHLCAHTCCLHTCKETCVRAHEWKRKNTFVCLRGANCRHAVMCPTYKAGCWEIDKAKLPPTHSLPSFTHATHMCTDSVNRPVRAVEPWQSFIHRRDYWTVITAAFAF